MVKSNVVKFQPATKVVTVKAHKRVIKTKRATKPVVAPKPVVAAKPVLYVNRGAILMHTQSSALITQITAQTEKAWLFTAFDMHGNPGKVCWLPKSAIEIVSNQNDNLRIKLAAWFTPRGFTYRWLNYNAITQEMMRRTA